eukprot:6599293-Alexandrium_andersonii.AAC.1
MLGSSGFFVGLTEIQQDWPTHRLAELIDPSPMSRVAGRIVSDGLTYPRLHASALGKANCIPELSQGWPGARSMSSPWG